jgi:hypothetical protein
MHLPAIIIGGSGHAKGLLSTLLMQHRSVLGFVDVNPWLPSLPGIGRPASPSQRPTSR